MHKNVQFKDEMFKYKKLKKQPVCIFSRNIGTNREEFEGLFFDCDFVLSKFHVI